MRHREWFSGVIGFALGSAVVGYDAGASWWFIGACGVIGLFAWIQRRSARLQSQGRDG